MSENLRDIEQQRAEHEKQGQVVRDFLSDYPEIAQRLGLSLGVDDAQLFTDFAAAVSDRPSDERRVIMDEVYRRDREQVMAVRLLSIPSNGQVSTLTLEDLRNEPDITREQTDPAMVRAYHLGQAHQQWRGFADIARQVDDVEAMVVRAQQTIADPDSTLGSIQSAMARVGQYSDALGRSWKNFQQQTVPSVVEHLQAVADMTVNVQSKAQIERQIASVVAPPILDSLASTIQNLYRDFDQYGQDAKAGVSAFDRVRRGFEDTIEDDFSFDENTPRPSL